MISYKGNFQFTSSGKIQINSYSQVSLNRFTVTIMRFIYTEMSFTHELRESTVTLRRYNNACTHYALIIVAQQL